MTVGWNNGLTGLVSEIVEKITKNGQKFVQLTIFLAGLVIKTTNEHIMVLEHRHLWHLVVSFKSCSSRKIIENSLDEVDNMVGL